MIDFNELAEAMGDLDEDVMVETLEQVMADAFDASSSEAGIFLPCNSPDKKNPVNVSPAAVVSTAFILKAG